MKGSPGAKRSALALGSILLFGCGTPFEILLHNELPTDAEFTVKWKADQTTTRDVRAIVPSGGAETVPLSWGGPPVRIDVEWRTTDGHSGKITGNAVPESAYHVFVSAHQVRFAPKSQWDDISELFVRATPLFTCCGVVILFPTAILVLTRRRRSGK